MITKTMHKLEDDQFNSDGAKPDHNPKHATAANCT